MCLACVMRPDPGPVTAARQSRSSCSRHEARSTMSCSSSSGPGPSAFRQSPHARADAGTLWGARSLHGL